MLQIEVRKSPRSSCRVSTQVRHVRQSVEGRIVNVSKTGLALELAQPLPVGLGSTVVLENNKIGLIEGIVRWQRGGRIGLQFSRTSNSSAKMDAYFRFEHEEVRPVLKR